MGFLNLGKISLDGSKVKANASEHSALSWGHATELEEQLKAEVARLMGFRQFHLRGLDDVSGEWTLVTMAWNLKRLFNLSQQSSPTTDPRPRSRSQSRKRRSGSPQWSGNVPRQSISAFIRRIVFEVSDHTLFGARQLLPSPTGC